MNSEIIPKLSRERALLDGLQLLARFEADSFSGRNGNFGAGARIASDACFPGADIEHAEAAQLNALAVGQRTLHAFKYRFDRHLGLGFRNPSSVDHFIDNIELDHSCLGAKKSW